MIKSILLSGIVFICCIFFFLNHTEAQSDASLPAITIINPIRGNGLGHEKDDLVASLKAQWQVSKEAEIQATWLLQYGALENIGITEFAKQEMKGQEFGLLFEIDRNYSEKANVQFRGQGAWYFSDGLLLSSYDPKERRMLIDKAFSKFKQIFGYYPKTVGAWWIGGDSLLYMQKKYGISSALRAADQFNLDFYSIWGTPWNIPYLPSKENEGIPAASFDESSKVVILQWAIRDPFKGYEDATYSLQDYSMKGYSTDYVDYLASIYLQKPFGNFVMGLENGGTLELFQHAYKTMLIKAKEIQKTGKADIMLARDYSQKFLSQKKVFAGRTHFLSKNFDSTDQSFWYLSENYRATIRITKEGVQIIDLRNYVNKTPEDFDILPNSQGHLRINEPEIIDSMRFPDNRILIRSTSESLTIKENRTGVDLFAGNKLIAQFSPTECKLYFENDTVKTYSFYKDMRLYPLHIITFLYIFYFAVLYLIIRNYRKVLKNILLLLPPLFFAFGFLVPGSAFLFDAKEIVFLNILFSIHLLPVLVTVYITKILPFLFLIVIHFLCVVKTSHRVNKLLYWSYYVSVIILYFHVSYFPLDKTTYTSLVVAFISTAFVFYAIAIIIYLKNKSKYVFSLCALIPMIILLLLTVTVIFSRSKIALAMYEIQAMQFIKDQKKSVLYIEQVDYSIRPIYKAVKPLLYVNKPMGQRITGKKWETVMRPENDILDVTNYENKIIVIPRYLGSDISDYEINLLRLKKIFDNAQIAIFEKI